MKLLLAAIFISISVVYCQKGRDEEKYTDRYDSMNIDEMLKNKRLVFAYMRCLEGTGKCTAEGRYLKTHITDALQTGCKKCTEAQQKGVRRVLQYMLKKEPRVWEKLVKMYDPKGEYSKKYSDQIKTLIEG